MEPESPLTPLTIKEESSLPSECTSTEKYRAKQILVDLESQGPVRSGEVLHCPLCPKTFSYRNGLIRHVKTLHLKEKPFKCEVCDRSFGYKNILVEHQNLHYGIKPYSCTHCGKRFAARSNLVQHRVSHKSSFSCHLCYKVFDKAGEFKRHLMDSHPKGILECGSCDFVAKSQRQLSQHVMSNHVVNAGCLMPRSSSESEGSPYKTPDRNAATPVSRHTVSCPLPSIDTFQSLQTPSPSFRPVFGSDFTPDFTQASFYPVTTRAVKQDNRGLTSCAFSSPSFLERDIKPEPLSPDHFNNYNDPTYPSLSGVKIERSILPPDLPVAEPPVSHSLKRSTVHVPYPSPPKQSRSSPAQVESTTVGMPPSSSSVAASPGGADSTTNVADLMNSLQSWMDRWNESSIPGAPQISITITPRSSHPSPDGTPARNPALVPDVEQVITQEINLGRLFECQYCGIVFRERGLYFLHASLHDSVTPFRCSICHTTCNDKNDFHLHFINQPHHD